MAAKCQEPDTICHICYSVEDMQIKDDIIEAQNILLEDTIEYFESLIAFQDSALNNNLNYFGARKDTFLYTVSGVTDSISVEVNKKGRNIEITLIDENKRSHLDLKNDKRTSIFATENKTVGLLSVD